MCRPRLAVAAWASHPWQGAGAQRKMVAWSDAGFAASCYAESVSSNLTKLVDQQGAAIMITKLRSSMIAVVCAALLLATPAQAFAQGNGKKNAGSPVAIPIVGSVVGGGAFAGTFTL